MKALRAVVVWLLLLLLLAVICWGTALVVEWPAWVAVALFFGVLALYLAGRLAARLWVLARARSALAARSAAPTAEARGRLARKWRGAAALLRTSALRFRGRALHALPWYLVLGPSGTGKTTALTRARLAAPLQRVSQRAPIEQTLDCDWWYFDHAVVLDCAGRYVDAADAEADRREWQACLDLLGRYRGGAGVDGVILAVRADRLASPDADAFADQGRVARMRIDALMRMFGRRFPVYVLVTQCDRLYGFEEWSRALDADAIEQALGTLVPPDDADEAAVVAAVFDRLGERLGRRRLELAAAGHAPTAPLLVFPAELDRLRPGLELFLRASVGSSAYLERPLLRGVFLCSGLQAGGAAPAVDPALPRSAPHAPGSAGVFLRAVFDRILPGDRGVSRPTRLRNPWMRQTRAIALAAWGFAGLAAGAVLIGSAAGNLRSLELARAMPVLAPRGDAAARLDTLLRQAAVLARIEANDRRWMSALLAGPGRVDAVERALCRRFSAHAHRLVDPERRAAEARALARLDAAGDAAGGAARDTADDTPQAGPLRALLALDLARSIAQIEARRDGADRAAIDAMPQALPLPGDDPGSLSWVVLGAAELACTDPADPVLDTRLARQRASLDQLVRGAPQAGWLAGLVRDGIDAPAVGVGSFWGAATAATASASSGSAVTPSAVVPAAYTRAGRAVLDGRLAEIRAQVSDPAAFDAQRRDAEVVEAARRLAAWQGLAAAVVAPPPALATEADWRAALGPSTEPQGPYFALLARLDREFGGRDPGAAEHDADASADAADAALPGWLRTAVVLDRWRRQAAGASHGVRRMVGAIDAAGGGAIRDTLHGAPGKGRRRIGAELGGVDAMAAYLGALQALAAQAGGSPAHDVTLAAEFHQGAADGKPSASRDAWAALDRLRGAAAGAGRGDDGLAWRLAAGPLALVTSYLERQASCELQRHWQADVLWPLRTVPSRQAMLDQLFGDKGTVWAFADGPGKPFLAREADRYVAVRTHGFSVPLAPELLPMLNAEATRRAEERAEAQRDADDAQRRKLLDQRAQLQAKQQLAELDGALEAARQKGEAASAAPIALTITSRPMGVNREARARPFAAVLTVQCAKGAQRLSNFNVPATLSFAWQPAQCGQADLEIRIGGLTLTRSYPGPLGVAALITEFRSGVRRFTPADFPAAAAGLRALGVTELVLGYTFDGSEAVLAAASAVDAHARLQARAARERPRIEAELAARQQLDVDSGLARVPDDGAPPGPDALGLPAVVGLCWSREAPPGGGAGP